LSEARAFGERSGLNCRVCCVAKPSPRWKVECFSAREQPTACASTARGWCAADVAGVYRRPTRVNGSTSS